MSKPKKNIGLGHTRFITEINDDPKQYRIILESQEPTGLLQIVMSPELIKQAYALCLRHELDGYKPIPLTKSTRRAR